MGYRPRTGSIFFTRNGKKLDDVAHGLKSQNFFPTVGANGPCTVHVNFGQSGFVFIEANVKKWGLAPMTGSLAPPPPYGSEQGSILLETGREGSRQQIFTNLPSPGHVRASSRNIRVTTPTSPGPERSPTEISLAQLAHIPSHEDVGEGTSRSVRYSPGPDESSTHDQYQPPFEEHEPQDFSAPPPEYTSPAASLHSRRSSEDGSESSGADSGRGRRSTEEDSERRRLIDPNSTVAAADAERRDTPIPSYDAAVGNDRANI